MLMLDGVDRGLIHALHLDGRVPFSRVAAVLGTSTQTVARRYQRLRSEAGLRVVGLPDPEQLGLTQWMVRISCTPAATQSLAHSLARRLDTSWVKLTSGGTEIFAVIATEPGAAGGSHALLLHDIPRKAGITAVSAHCMLHTYLGGVTAWSGHLEGLTASQQAELLKTSYAENPTSHGKAATKTPIQGPGRTGHGGLSRGDRELVEALRTDGRAGYAELAAATGLSQATVARRLADLRGRGAVFFDVDIAPVLLGATTQALLWMSVAPAQLDTTGPTNLVAQALCSSPVALHRYLTQSLGAFDAIRSLEAAPVLHTVKATGPVWTGT
jgi:DNA-binding Lrp family transcriptional regulator